MNVKLKSILLLSILLCLSIGLVGSVYAAKDSQTDIRSFTYSVIRQSPSTALQSNVAIIGDTVSMQIRTWSGVGDLRLKVGFVGLAPTGPNTNADRPLGDTLWIVGSAPDTSINASKPDRLFRIVTGKTDGVTDSNIVANVDTMGTNGANANINFASNAALGVNFKLIKSVIDPATGDTAFSLKWVIQGLAARTIGRNDSLPLIPVVYVMNRYFVGDTTTLNGKERVSVQAATGAGWSIDRTYPTNPYNVISKAGKLVSAQYSGADTLAIGDQDTLSYQLANNYSENIVGGISPTAQIYLDSIATAGADNQYTPSGYVNFKGTFLGYANGAFKWGGLLNVTESNFTTVNGYKVKIFAVDRFGNKTQLPTVINDSTGLFDTQRPVITPSSVVLMDTLDTSGRPAPYNTARKYNTAYVARSGRLAYSASDPVRVNIAWSAVDTTNYYNAARGGIYGTVVLDSILDNISPPPAQTNKSLWASSLTTPASYNARSVKARTIGANAFTNTFIDSVGYTATITYRDKAGNAGASSISVPKFWIKNHFDVALFKNLFPSAWAPSNQGKDTINAAVGALRFTLGEKLDSMRIDYITTGFLAPLAAAKQEAIGTYHFRAYGPVVNAGDIDISLINWEQVIPSDNVSTGKLGTALADSNIYKVMVYGRDYAGNQDSLSILGIVFRKDYIEPILGMYTFTYNVVPPTSNIVNNAYNIIITARDSSNKRTVVTYNRAVQLDATQIGLQTPSRISVFSNPANPQTVVTLLTTNSWRIEPQSWASGSAYIKINDLTSEQITLKATGKVGGFRADSVGVVKTDTSALTWKPDIFRSLAVGFGSINVETTGKNIITSATTDTVGTDINFYCAATDKFSNVIKSLGTYKPAVAAPPDSNLAVQFGSTNTGLIVPSGWQPLPWVTAYMNGKATATKAMTGVKITATDLMWNTSSISAPIDIIVAITPPTGLRAADYKGADGKGDKGGFVLLTWNIPSNVGTAGITQYRVYRQIAVDSVTKKYVSWATISAPASYAELDSMRAIVATLGDPSGTNYKVAAEVTGVGASSGATVSLGKVISSKNVFVANVNPNYAIAKIADNYGSNMSNAAYATANSELPPAPATSITAWDNPNDNGGAVLVKWNASPDDKILSSYTMNGQVIYVKGVEKYGILRDGILVGTSAAGTTSYIDVTNDSKQHSYTVNALDISNSVPGTNSYTGFAAANNSLIKGWFAGGPTVGIADFSLFVSRWGTTSASSKWQPIFDLNGDGVIDIKDFSLFVKDYGKSTGTAKLNPVAGMNYNTSLALKTNDNVVNVGEEFGVLVSINNATSLNGLAFTMKYDSRKVDFVRAVPVEKNLLTSNGAVAPLFYVNNDEPGKVTVVQAIDGNVAGSGDFAVLTFKLLNDNSGALVISNAEVSDANYSVNTVKANSAKVAAKPKSYALYQNYPNPFNPSTTIKYDLPEAASIKIQIFNSLGQVVRSYTNEGQKAGYHAFVWDGKDEAGLTVSSGTYFYRIDAGNFTSTKKMILVK
jgi:hypothetical protein